MDEDVATSRRLIARLSALLRTVLDVGEAREVPLVEEIELLERYLDIERVRYGERLKVRFEIDEEATGALVPPLILQPLVENAVRHGIAPLEEGGSILVRARRERGRLRLDVEDTGRGVGDGPATGRGLGLRNTESRLQHLYGAGHSFQVGPGPGRGVAVRIEIPFRRAETAVDIPGARA
jgi:LytS/YehU family sensor histidine kinase